MVFKILSNCLAGLAHGCYHFERRYNKLKVQLNIKCPSNIITAVVQVRQLIKRNVPQCLQGTHWQTTVRIEP